MPRATTRDLLLEHGALLYARSGVNGVTSRQLHQAVGARNESALHYHFGSQAGLVEAILRTHLDAVEARRRLLVNRLDDQGRRSVRALVHALAQPMADDLATAIGRAHLRILDEVSHPELAFEPAFPGSLSRLGSDASAGAQMVAWLHEALHHILPELPSAIRAERLAALRAQLIGGHAGRARLLDEDRAPGGPASTTLFLENLVDMASAALSTPPSAATLAAL